MSHADRHLVENIQGLIRQLDKIVKSHYTYDDPRRQQRQDDVLVSEDVKTEHQRWWDQWCHRYDEVVSHFLTKEDKLDEMPDIFNNLVLLNNLYLEHEVYGGGDDNDDNDDNAIEWTDIK